jgi:hypothetical protein
MARGALQAAGDCGVWVVRHPGLLSSRQDISNPPWRIVERA